ncbi:MAG TPA: KEOPS complex subunit Pcc1 [Thermoplasmata archaeon]|nr:KEOPS complex subunit Pcc1 [Thermoplasmata archaeon]
MSDDATEWIARIVVTRDTPALADRLAQTLLPESAREVPRARAVIARRGERAVEITVRARDTGALRAAVNTFLGWVALVSNTERVADAPPGPEALI